MNFLEFMGEDQDDYVQFEADVPDGEAVPEVANVDLDQEVVVLSDTAQGIARKEELLASYANLPKRRGKKGDTEVATSGVASRRNGSKRKGDDAGTSGPKQPKKGKVLKGVQLEEPVGGTYRLLDEDNAAEGLGPGKGKSPGALKRIPHNVRAASQTLPDPDGEESVTGGHYAPTPSPSVGAHFDGIPDVPDNDGPFSVTFPSIPFKSALDTEEERVEFVRGSMVPVRLQNMAMMTHGSFKDFANETVIRNMCIQAEYLRRWDQLRDEKDRLRRQNSVLQRQLKKHVKSGNREVVEAKFEELRTETLLEKKKTEMVEADLGNLQRRFDDLGLEKDEWRRRCEEALKKIEDLTLEVAGSEGKGRELQLRVQTLETEVERITGDRKQIIMGLPGVVKKLHKSCEFAKEMAKVQRRAVNLGGHKSLEKIRGRPGLDITKLAGYNPEAMEDLKAAGKVFEEAEYEYLNKLASSSDLPAEEFLLIDPAPFPSKPTVTFAKITN